MHALMMDCIDCVHCAALGVAYLGQVTIACIVGDISIDGILLGSHETVSY